MKNYMHNPESYIISQRLNDLVSKYGKALVHDELYYNWTGESQLELHINNLLLTYPTSVILETAELIFRDKVG